jgi:hypothetical protein
MRVDNSTCMYQRKVDARIRTRGTRQAQRPSFLQSRNQRSCRPRRRRGLARRAKWRDPVGGVGLTRHTRRHPRIQRYAHIYGPGGLGVGRGGQACSDRGHGAVTVPRDPRCLRTLQAQGPLRHRLPNISALRDGASSGGDEERIIYLRRAGRQAAAGDSDAATGLRSSRDVLNRVPQVSDGAVPVGPARPRCRD